MLDVAGRRGNDRDVALFFLCVFLGLGVCGWGAVCESGTEAAAEGMAAEIQRQYVYNFAVSPEIVDEVRGIIKADYPLEIPLGVGEALSVSEMLEALGDPYAQYLTAGEFGNLVNVINMSFVGIGVSLEAHRDGILISEVYEGSPAAEAGLRQGDIVVNIDGVDLPGMAWQESSSRLQGEEGSPVEIICRRGGDTFSVRLVRQAVKIPLVEGEMIESVGYIAVSSFGADIAEEFRDTVATLRKEGAKSWVVDLSGNGGGLVESALELLGFFIGDRDAVMVRTSQEYLSEKAVLQKDTIDEPVIVLADTMTASASEIVIGALKDYGKASVLGEQTYGSGRFKQIFPLSNGDYFLMSTAQFFSPGGTSVDSVGLSPDVWLAAEDAAKVAVLLLKSGLTVSGAAEGSGVTEGGGMDDELAGGPDETGFLKLTIGAQSFLVSLADWRKEEYWRVGQEFIDQCFGAAMVDAGDGQGWQPLRQEDLAERWRISYPGYQILGRQDVDSGGSVVIQMPLPQGLGEYVERAELIDEVSGRRLEVSCRLTDQGVEMTAQEELMPYQSYWLVIADDEGRGAVAVLRAMEDSAALESSREGVVEVEIAL